MTGTYTLRTVNSAPLPFVYQQVGADRYEVLDDAISLADAGTWTEIWHERWTEGGVASLKTFTDAGSYSRSGSTVTLVSPTTGTITVTVTAGALTLTTQGIVAVYQQ